ncbi:MAG: NAD-dependent protein deacylase [Clostridia bacterium]|nr:NAD-dependent protein deacylase [Clostridia bacterium]
MEDKIKRLKEIIDGSDNIVLFTGAGISVPSGIPDFRSANGLYNSGLTKYGVSPEEAISHHFYELRTADFFEFYKNNMVFKDAKPNVAHKFFAELEKQGKLKAVVTQNIDGLHEQAGSKNVFNVHGNIYKNHCEDCYEFFDLDYVLGFEGIPLCDKCGGVVKPDVVLYEEALDTKTVQGAVDAIASADTLIVVGTSLVVQPASSFITNYFAGKNLVLINLQATPFDKLANLVINEKVEEVIKKLKELQNENQKQNK